MMYSLNIRMKSTSAPPSPNWGSLMHGMLIEHLTGHWPSALHEGPVRPVAQWVESIGDNKLVWHLQILNDPLAVNILQLIHTGDCWFCQHNGSRLIIEDLSFTSTGLNAYIERCLDLPARPLLDMHFRTATTHKSAGKYVLFPSPQLIANNLRNRLTGLQPSLELPDAHLDLLTDHTQIIQYHLQTVPFSLEGTRVEGYTGSLRMRLSGPDELISFGQMLYGLAQWFGVGIKTALGMGGCEVFPA